jgi:hypothetical protein
MNAENILTSIIFSTFGLAFFTYGKRRSEVRFIASGVALMGYTYFVDSTAWTVAIGLALIAAPFVVNR